MCNFTPKVLRKIEMRDTDNTVTCVAIKLCFEDGESDEIVIPLSDLKKQTGILLIRGVFLLRIAEIQGDMWKTKSVDNWDEFRPKFSTGLIAQG